MSPVSPIGISRGIPGLALMAMLAVAMPDANAQSAAGDWALGTSSAAWTGRHSFASAVFDNKMWVMGGRTALDEQTNDVWYSTNGTTWLRATASAGWNARLYVRGLDFGGKMWVMGCGQWGSTGYSNDVWWTTNGASWSRATASAGWSPRSGFGCVNYDNKMWVMGGYDMTNHLNDVWYSSNGTNWVRATASATWSKRRVAACMVFNSRMWVMGGDTASGTTNDVWWSTNGVSWTLATNKAAWAGLSYAPASCVYLDRMWILGGNPLGGSTTNETWYSSDGAAWTRGDGDNPWASRSGGAALPFGDSLWLIGGTGGGSGPTAFLNDTWFAPGLVIGISVSAIDLTWDSMVGIPYQVQWTTSLTLPAWSNLNGVVIGTGSNMYVTDVIRGLPPRFYRVLANP